MDSKIYSTLIIILYTFLGVVIINWLLPLFFGWIGLGIPLEVIKILDALIVLAGAWRLWLIWRI